MEATPQMRKKQPKFLRADEYLAKFGTHRVEAQLVATGDGSEVIRYIMQPGSFFHLVPAKNWDAMEHVTVLFGSLAWVQRGRKRVLEPGDSITACPVQEPIILTALEQTTFLYVCSQEVFHKATSNVGALRNLAVEVEEKDGYTAEHCQRLQELSAMVGEVLQLTPERQRMLLLASYLHDVGKVAVPDTILGKPGPLTPDEWVIMRKHPTEGRKMLEKTFLRMAARIVEQHHERVNGSGYPKGLQRDEILVEAQILAVVDSYDAMTTDRPYRKALTHEYAVAEVRRGTGTLYREDVVKAFLAAIEGTKS